MDDELHPRKTDDRPPQIAGEDGGAAPRTARASTPLEERAPDEGPEQYDPAHELAQTRQFEEQVKRVFEEAFPIFMDRIRRASFADWHRRHHKELDLAQDALMTVMRHCRNTRCIPADIVGYLVTTARNRAISDWHNRRKEPFLFADLDLVRAKPGARGGGRITTPEDDGDPLKPHSESNAHQANEARTVDRGRQLHNGDLRADTVPEEDLEANPPAGQIPAEPENTIAAHEQVRAAVEALPRRQRQAVQIYMHLSEEHTIAQMAAMMSPPISADGFEKNIERAMKRLRQALGSAGATPHASRKPESVGSQTPNG